MNWPLNLQRALQRSRILVAVWSPPYFRSQWCVAEWQSMRVREQMLGWSTPTRPLGLVYPVVYADGLHFPEEAKATQYRRDLSQWGFPRPQFQDTTEYQELWKCMREVAAEIAARLPSVPAWENDWPTVPIPALDPPPRLRLPTL